MKKSKSDPGRYVNILVYRHPEADKTVFMLHGLGGRGEQWQAQYAACRTSIPSSFLIYMDMVKVTNQNSGNNNPYSFPELDQDIHAIFNRYATKQNIVMGHSYGGALAASLANSYQGRISKLVLISPTPLAPDTSIPFFFKLPAPVMEVLRPLLEKSFRHLAFDPSTAPDLIENEIKISRQNPMYVIRGMVSGLLLTPKTDISRLTTSSLIILGETDHLIPPDVSRNFYQALPEHEFVMVQHAAHMANMEKPERVNEVVGKFLQGLVMPAQAGIQ